MSLVRSVKRHIDVPVEHFVLRVTGPEDVYDEARAAGMQFWEQLQSYAVRNRAFGTSKRPVTVPLDHPQPFRRMAAVAGAAGVGPMFTFRGALVEHVGKLLSARLGEVVVSCHGDWFVQVSRRSRLSVHHPGGGPGPDVAVVIKPELGSQGIYSTMADPRPLDRAGPGVVVVAATPILADAVAAAVTASMSHPDAFDRALRFVQGVRGVFGAMIVEGERIGLAGGLELAA